VPFVVGSLPTSTIAIQLTWSEWHRLRKPEKIDMAAYPSILKPQSFPIGSELDGAVLVYVMCIEYR